MKLLFISGKGGVGKSTLAYLFALTLSRVNKTISIRDLDPQESLTAWLDESPAVKIVANGEIVLIDTPPRLDDPIVLAAIAEADRIIIPTTPSPAEIAVARATANVVRNHKNKSCEAFVVMNRVKKGTLYARSLDKLMVGLALPVTKSCISDRELYKHVLLDGWRALDSAARDEITSLALEIQ
ncbi:MAG: ParA family protein [Verrucomicrobiota bacterium]